MFKLQPEPIGDRIKLKPLKPSDYFISTDVSSLDMDLVCRKLSEDSYWAAGRSHEAIRRSFENSHSFGIFRSDGKQMVGFCRVVSDFATVAYLLDVYILRSHRGRGLGKYFIQQVLDDSKLEKVRRFMLATNDAHQFYEQFGFSKIEHPEYFMEMYVDRKKDDNE